MFPPPPPPFFFFPPPPLRLISEENEPEWMLSIASKPSAIGKLCKSRHGRSVSYPNDLGDIDTFIGVRRFDGRLLRHRVRVSRQLLDRQHLVGQQATGRAHRHPGGWSRCFSSRWSSSSRSDRTSRGATSAFFIGGWLFKRCRGAGCWRAMGSPRSRRARCPRAESSCWASLISWRGRASRRSRPLRLSRHKSSVARRNLPRT